MHHETRGLEDVDLDELYLLPPYTLPLPRSNEATLETSFSKQDSSKTSSRTTINASEVGDSWCGTKTIKRTSQNPLSRGSEDASDAADDLILEAFDDEDAISEELADFPSLIHWHLILHLIQQLNVCLGLSPSGCMSSFFIFSVPFFVSSQPHLVPLSPHLSDNGSCPRFAGSWLFCVSRVFFLG